MLQDILYIYQILFWPDFNRSRLRASNNRLLRLIWLPKGVYDLPSFANADGQSCGWPWRGLVIAPWYN